jgi:hypothetical protein
MKGQGLPDRLRHDWHALRKVRDYIDERERAFARDVMLTMGEGEEGMEGLYEEGEGWGW